MKKRKFSLLLNIATICLCVCAIAIGVYSAKTANLSISGSIGFEAHNCEVKVLGSVSGANETVTSYQKEDGTGKEVSGDSESWAVGDITFNDLNCSNDEVATPIVFTFKMKNMSAYDVIADLDITGSLSTDVFYKVQFSSSDADYTVRSSGHVCILPKPAESQTEGIEVVVTVTLTPAIDNLSITLNSDLKLKFEKPQDETYYAEKLIFTYNETTNKAEPYTAGSNPGMSEGSISGDVVIPSSVVHDDKIYFVDISDRAPGIDTFGCAGITSVVLPNSLTAIGSFLFEYCSGMKSVNIPSSVTDLGLQGTFENCSSLTRITIPSSVTSINHWTFRFCSSLTSITIPSSVTEIVEEAFTDCSNLTTINFRGTKAQWEAIDKKGSEGMAWDYNTGNYTVKCTDGDIAKAS